MVRTQQTSPTEAKSSSHCKPGFGSVFAAIVGKATRRARKNSPDGTQIFAASMQDINRALAKLAERKQKKTEEEIQEEIPDKIGEQADAILDNDDGAVAPH
jgi:hypothetical protein